MSYDIDVYSAARPEPVSSYTKDHWQIVVYDSLEVESEDVPDYVTAFLPGISFVAHIYKWVDEEGVTHFSERPPPGGQDVEEVEIRAPNTIQPQRTRPISGASGKSHQEGELMRMPESVRTEFLRTMAGWTVEHTKKHGPVALSQTLHIEVMPSVAFGALLEVRFENPRGGIADVVEVLRPPKNVD